MPTTETNTIEQYLQGKVRNITVTDDAFVSILTDAGITAGTSVTELSEQQREIALAWLYVWVASSPTMSEKVSDQDGDWSHSEGGEQMSATVLNRYLRMANDIFSKYGLPTIGSNSWGMVGNGFHNIRYTSNSRRR